MWTQFKENSLKKYFLKISDIPWIPIIFSIGAFLRISGFTVARMWYDELFSLHMTHQTLFEMINSLKINISPPGWETLLWFVVRVFGWNAFSLRLPSVVASILTLWIVFKIGITLKFSKGQLIAIMLMVALLPYQLISAQMGRVYALFTMFYLLGIYAALLRRWLLLGISIVALFWCHNISFMFVPGLFIIAIFIHLKDWKKIIFIFFLSVLAFLPWFGITLTQALKPIPWFTALTLDYFINDFIFALSGFNLPQLAIGIGFIESLILCIGIVFFPLARWIYRDMRTDIETLKTSRMKIKTLLTKFISKKINLENSFSLYKVKWILFLAFSVSLSLLTVTSILRQNILIIQTASILIIPIIMWMITIYVVPRPNIFHRIIWGISILLLLTGIIYWTPTQLDGGFTNLENVVHGSFKRGYVLSSTHSYQPGDAFFHDSGDTALIFYHYFPNEPNYLMDGDDVFLHGDIIALKVPIPQVAPEKINAQRLWVVSIHDFININKTAYERTHQLIDKYNCPLVSYLQYPQSLDVEVYLCDLHQK
jgi:hypothetical protein